MRIPCNTQLPQALSAVEIRDIEAYRCGDLIRVETEKYRYLSVNYMPNLTLHTPNPSKEGA